METESIVGEADAQHQPDHAHELVFYAWRRSFEKDCHENDAQRAVYDRLLNLIADHEDTDDEALISLLLRDIGAKMHYLDPDWGFVDASNIGTNLKNSLHIVTVVLIT